MSSTETGTRTGAGNRGAGSVDEALRRDTAAAAGGRSGPCPDPEPDLSIELQPCAPGDAAAAAVRSVAAAGGLGAPRADRLGVLVEQLVAEARAREAVGGAEAVTVVARHHGPGLEVEVTDRRIPMSPGEARSASSRRLVAAGFADHLHLHSDGPGGNVAVCTLRPDVPEDLGHLDEVLGEDAPRVTDQQAAALEIRTMVPEDAMGLTRCVYRCYGYSYVDPTMYRPAQVRRALERGDMRSTVAVSGDGEVVGHCALVHERSDDPVPEGARMVVDPRWRGHHVAERMAAHRRDEARRDGIPGYWAECVTVHPFSQREAISVGGAETGLLISATPPTRMEGLADRGPGRRSLLAVHVPLSDRAPRVVHLPPRHRDLLLVIAERLGLPRDARVTRSRAVGTTTVRTGVDRNLGTAHLRVGNVGHDLVDRVRSELDGLAAFALGAVHVDVPLADPAAPDAVERLEEQLGLCWAAWMPSFVAGGDVLRMQLVLDRSVDLSGIECARPQGDEVRDRVIAEWSRVRR